MKYLIYKEHGPVLWGGSLTHSQMAYAQNDIAFCEGNQVIAGGEVAITPIYAGDLHGMTASLEVVCFGAAEGMKNIVSHGEMDAKLIRAMMITS